MDMDVMFYKAGTWMMIVGFLIFMIGFLFLITSFMLSDI